jgi:signal transduction histidine kinase
MWGPVMRAVMGLVTVLVLGLLMAGAPAQAGPALPLGPNDPPVVSLTDYLEVLEDAAGTLTLAEVQSPDIASRFAPLPDPRHASSLGYSRSAFWLRLTLRNTSVQPVERLLEIAYPLLSHVQFHAPSAGGPVHSITTGMAHPFATRPYRSRFFVFPVTLAPEAQQVLYLRVSSTSAVIVPASLWQRPAFHAHERADYGVQAWYFGMAAAMVLFNLLIFAALRDTVYLLYVAFALLFPLTIGAHTGLAKEFLWPDTTWWSNAALNVCGSVTLMALLLFMRRLLSTATLMPRVDRVIWWFIAAQAPLPIAFLVSIEPFTRLSIVLLAATQGLVLFVGLYGAAVKRQPLAMVFLVAFSLYLVGVAAVGFRALGWLPTNLLTVHGFQIGSALEMLWMALALAYRFILIRREALADVEQANASLSQRLQAREAELTRSHEQLRENALRQSLSQERLRLTQDMHDGMGSSLTSALKGVEQGRLDKAQVAQVLQGCLDDLKLVIDAMETADADLLLLLTTLRYRLAPRLEAAGIALRWQVHSLPALAWLDAPGALHLLRILQEAFTNILKHAQATEIRVSTRAESDAVVVSIHDNGRGFALDAAREAGGKGLANQLRRAHALGAEITWETGSSGTGLSLRLPIHQPPHITQTA